MHCLNFSDFTSVIILCVSKYLKTNEFLWQITVSHERLLTALPLSGHWLLIYIISVDPSGRLVFTCNSLPSSPPFLSIPSQHLPSSLSLSRSFEMKSSLLFIVSLLIVAEISHATQCYYGNILSLGHGQMDGTSKVTHYFIYESSMIRASWDIYNRWESLHLNYEYNPSKFPEMILRCTIQVKLMSCPKTHRCCSKVT